MLVVEVNASFGLRSELRRNAGREPSVWSILATTT